MNKYVKYGVISGAIFGVIQIPLSFMFMNVDFFIQDFLGLEQLLYCKIFGIGGGEGCAFVYIFSGIFVLPIAYGIIGLIIGILWSLIKK